MIRKANIYLSIMTIIFIASNLHAIDEEGNISEFSWEKAEKDSRENLEEKTEAKDVEHNAEIQREEAKEEQAAKKESRFEALKRKFAEHRSNITESLKQHGSRIADSFSRAKKSVTEFFNPAPKPVELTRENVAKAFRTLGLQHDATITDLATQYSKQLNRLGYDNNAEAIKEMSEAKEIARRYLEEQKEKEAFIARTSDFVMVDGPTSK